jgi:hypothetical protein
VEGEGGQWLAVLATGLGHDILLLQTDCRMYRGVLLRSFLLRASRGARDDGVFLILVGRSRTSWHSLFSFGRRRRRSHPEEERQSRLLRLDSLHVACIRPAGRPTGSGHQ